jgi:light-regulated signal transduction histidine kinase (bacteriophytochrome)
VDGGERMKNLINDLLDYSRLDTQGKPFVPVDMNEILTKTLTLLEVPIKENSAEITIDKLPTVLADETQMIQVMQNLIGNAIRYRGNEKPRIHIASSENTKEYMFSVQDNGIGLNMVYADKIFQMFQRLHPRGQYEGSGVGLAIVKKIVERHGGRLWVESEEGKGSTFFFTIPKVRG